MLKKSGIYLILLLLLTLILNTIDLEINPVGLNQDESSNGYDAYSLGKTLRDFNGNFLPAMLESYGDWVSPVLTYLTVPFVKLLGLSTFSVRLPVALLNCLSVYFFYLLCLKIFNKRSFSLAGATIYATSPVFLTFSRWAVPPSIVPFFIILCTWALFLFLDSGEEHLQPKKPFLKSRTFKAIFLGFVSGLLILSYPTQKLFVPLFALFTFLIYFKTHWKSMIISGCVMLALALPQYLLTFSNPEKYNRRFLKVASLSNVHEDYFTGFYERYFEYFSFDFLFGKGDLQIIHHVKQLPAIYPLFSLFFYIGIIALFIYICLPSRLVIKPSIKNLIPFEKRSGYLLFSWFLLFPLAASLTKDHFITTRVLHGIPLVILLILFGMVLSYRLLHYFYDYLKLHNHFKKWTGVVLSTLLFAYVFTQQVNFISVYHGSYKEDCKVKFHYGVKQALRYAIQHEQVYDTIYVDEFILAPDVLFFIQYDPALLHQTTGINKLKVFGKYIRADVSPYYDQKFKRLFQEKTNGRLWSEVVEVSPSAIAVLKYEKND